MAAPLANVRPTKDFLDGNRVARRSKQQQQWQALCPPTLPHEGLAARSLLYHLYMVQGELELQYQEEPDHIESNQTAYENWLAGIPGIPSLVGIPQLPPVVYYTPELAEQALPRHCPGVVFFWQAVCDWAFRGRPSFAKPHWQCLRGPSNEEPSADDFVGFLYFLGLNDVDVAAISRRGISSHFWQEMRAHVDQRGGEVLPSADLDIAERMADDKDNEVDLSWLPPRQLPTHGDQGIAIPFVPAALATSGAHLLPGPAARYVVRGDDVAQAVRPYVPAAKKDKGKSKAVAKSKSKGKGKGKGKAKPAPAASAKGKGKAKEPTAPATPLRRSARHQPPAEPSSPASEAEDMDVDTGVYVDIDYEDEDDEDNDNDDDEEEDDGSPAPPSPASHDSAGSYDPNDEFSDLESEEGAAVEEEEEEDVPPPPPIRKEGFVPPSIVPAVVNLPRSAKLAEEWWPKPGYVPLHPDWACGPCMVRSAPPSQVALQCYMDPDRPGHTCDCPGTDCSRCNLSREMSATVLDRYTALALYQSNPSPSFADRLAVWQVIRTVALSVSRTLSPALSRLVLGEVTLPAAGVVAGSETEYPAGEGWSGIADDDFPQFAEFTGDDIPIPVARNNNGILRSFSPSDSIVGGPGTRVALPTGVWVVPEGSAWLGGVFSCHACVDRGLLCLVPVSHLEGQNTRRNCYCCKTRWVCSLNERRDREGVRNRRLARLFCTFGAWLCSDAAHSAVPESAAWLGVLKAVVCGQYNLLGALPAVPPGADRLAEEVEQWNRRTWNFPAAEMVEVTFPGTVPLADLRFAPRVGLPSLDGDE